jgi:hypothetical protein
LQTKTVFTTKNKREGYATSLQDSLFENELNTEVKDPKPGTIVSRSFFSDFYGQDPQATPALLASF